MYRASEHACDVKETAVGLSELVDELWRWRKALNAYVNRVIMTQKTRREMTTGFHYFLFKYVI